VNLYVFNIFIEVFLVVPVLTTLGVLAAAATATGDKYKAERKFINKTLAAVSFGLIAYSVVHIAFDFHNFATTKTLEDFLTPIVLTLAFLPFVYIVAIYSTYEALFTQMRIRVGNDEALLSYARRQIALACALKLSNVRRFGKDFVHKIGPSDTRYDVDRVLSDFKSAPRHEEKPSPSREGLAQ
jgi:cytochrome c oxidase assembly factor CtaG